MKQQLSLQLLHPSWSSWGSPSPGQGCGSISMMKGPAASGHPQHPGEETRMNMALAQAWCQPALHLTLQVCLSLLAAALRTSSSSISGKNNGPTEVQPASAIVSDQAPRPDSRTSVCTDCLAVVLLSRNSNCCMFDFRSMKTKYDPALSQDVSCADERGVRGFQAKGRGMITGNMTPAGVSTSLPFLRDTAPLAWQ